LSIVWVHFSARKLVISLISWATEIASSLLLSLFISRSDFLTLGPSFFIHAVLTLHLVRMGIPQIHQDITFPFDPDLLFTDMIKALLDRLYEQSLFGSFSTFECTLDNVIAKFVFD
jgi:hypothetical protein